jgi:hypothetical protein
MCVFFFPEMMLCVLLCLLLLVYTHNGIKNNLIIQVTQLYTQIPLYLILSSMKSIK